MAGARRAETQVAVPRGTLNEERLTEILDAAEAVLAEKGFRDATIQDLASQVGLAKGSLYYYIENKEDLLFQVLRRGNLRYLQVLRADPFITSGAPVSRLLRFIDLHMQQVEHDRSWNTLDERQDVFLDADNLAAINGLRQKTYRILKGILSDGMSAGVFSEGMDPSVAANSILSLMNSTTRWYKPRGRHSIEEIGEWYKAMILDGLRSEPAPAPGGPFGQKGLVTAVSGA